MFPNPLTMSTNRVRLFDEPQKSHYGINYPPCQTPRHGNLQDTAVPILPFCPFSRFTIYSNFAIKSRTPRIRFSPLSPSTPLPSESQVGRQRRQDCQGPQISGQGPNRRRALIGELSCRRLSWTRRISFQYQILHLTEIHTKL